MHPDVIKFYRDRLKEKLGLCTEPEQFVFKRMYSYDDLKRDISTVVDKMEASKLDWALTQVEGTLAKKKGS